jgi:hypothetical protein
MANTTALPPSLASRAATFLHNTLVQRKRPNAYEIALLWTTVTSTKRVHERAVAKVEAQFKDVRCLALCHLMELETAIGSSSSWKGFPSLY